jgi:beta-xylosidase
MTYSNPVYPGYFADPFCLKVGKDYYAYATGQADKDGNQFPILHSRDLSHWEPAGHALKPLPNGVNYWAPEVAEKDGKFYLFYSASTTPSDDSHRLRVAVSDSPAGPFIDSGRELMPDIGFSIDASPFRDPVTNKWYLYFAADYTHDQPFGTGLAVVELAPDLLTVIGKPEPVLRASCDWQIYQRNRDYKGKTWPAWHCVEGPFVLHHDGKYFCLYSGGAWHTENYGVGFAVADHPLGPWRDDFAKHGATVLKGDAKQIIGPGHNSVVLGPDDQTPFVIYHAWDQARTARRMCIDPLKWTPDGPRCDGPSIGTKTVQL